MLGRWFFVAVSAWGFASTAGAADLDGMSRAQQRIYCVANGLIEIGVRHDAGMMGDAEYDHTRNQLIWKIQNKGDNYNYASDFRRLNQAVKDIVAANPSMAEVSATARQCDSILHL